MDEMATPARQTGCRLLRDSPLRVPPLYQGFGLPPVEAMAWGATVLMSKVCPVPQVFGEAAMPVDPFDVKASAAGIRLVEDHALRDEMCRKLLERARQFSEDKTARRTRPIVQPAGGKATVFLPKDWVAGGLCRQN